MRDLARHRSGAPPGFCTILGEHVPAEHAEPIRYFAQLLALNDSREEGQAFIAGHRSRGWIDLPKLRELWVIKIEIGKNRRLLRALNWEAEYVHQNRR